MRLAVVILALGAIAVGLVQIRSLEIAARQEIHRVQTAKVRLRRDLNDQQVRMGQLLSPAEVQRRVEALHQIEPEETPGARPAARSAAHPAPQVVPQPTPDGRPRFPDGTAP